MKEKTKSEKLARLREMEAKRDRFKAIRKRLAELDRIAESDPNFSWDDVQAELDGYRLEVQED